jgi:hypothetical protein
MIAFADSPPRCRTSSTLGFLRPRRNSANDHRCMQSQGLDHARCHPTIMAQQAPAAMRHRRSGPSASRSPHPATRGSQIPIGALRRHQAQFGARFRPLEVFRRRPHQTPRVAGAKCVRKPHMKRHRCEALTATLASTRRRNRRRPWGGTGRASRDRVRFRKTYTQDVKCRGSPRAERLRSREPYSRFNLIEFDRSATSSLLSRYRSSPVRLK